MLHPGNDSKLFKFLHGGKGNIFVLLLALAISHEALVDKLGEDVMIPRHLGHDNYCLEIGRNVIFNELHKCDVEFYKGLVGVFFLQNDNFYHQLELIVSGSNGGNSISFGKLIPEILGKISALETGLEVWLKLEMDNANSSIVNLIPLLSLIIVADEMFESVLTIIIEWTRDAEDSPVPNRTQIILHVCNPVLVVEASEMLKFCESALESHSESGGNEMSVLCIHNLNMKRQKKME